MKKPEIIWKGKTKQVATVQGHRIGFAEEWGLSNSDITYRWDSRYTETGYRPCARTMEEAKSFVEKAFCKWFDKVMKEIGE